MPRNATHTLSFRRPHEWPRNLRTGGRSGRITRPRIRRFLTPEGVRNDGVVLNYATYSTSSRRARKGSRDLVKSTRSESKTRPLIRKFLATFGSLEMTSIASRFRNIITLKTKLTTINIYNKLENII